MRLLFLCALLALPLLAVAQQNTSSCDNCQHTFALTKQELWVITANNKTLCQSGFADATGFAVDTVSNQIYVVDAGMRGLWKIDLNCTNKTAWVMNDEKQWSFFYPLDVAFDSIRQQLYVSMRDIDPLWSTYAMPRRLLAREKHVYRFGVNNGELSGTYDILAKGVDNGKDITYLKWAEDKLTAVRKDKYISVLLDDVWEDYLGPQNSFNMDSNFVSLRAIDFNFRQCGYLAAVAREDNQFMICTNDTSVSQCKARCPDKTLFSRVFGDLFSGNNSTNSSGGGNNQQSDLLPFIDPMFPLNIDEASITEQISKNLSVNLLNDCDDLVLPSAVFIDCECNLFIADRGVNEPKLYKYVRSSNNSGSGGDINFDSPTDVMNFSLPVVKIDVFNLTNCAAPEPEPTPEPTGTAQPTPEPTSTAQPTPQPTSTAQPTPEPTATSQPTPQPTSTAQPTPEPTATSQPTAAPSSIFQRLHRLV